MPLLSAEQQRDILIELPAVCGACGQHPFRNYCRECDEFFLECGCPRTEHVGHRTYQQEPALRGEYQDPHAGLHRGI
jgi:hypothetical protein